MMYCNKCNTEVASGFICIICNNFKLCMYCHDKKDYSQSHEMHASSELHQDHPENILENSELPIKRFVRLVFHAYSHQEGSDGNTFASLCEHIVATNLHCNCIICKQMFLVYEHHSKHCQMPNCRVSQCPVVNDRQLQKRLVAFNTRHIERKLLKGRPRDVEISTDPAGNALSVKMLTRKFMIQRCIRTLVHACQCLEADCMPVSCKKMKRVLAHIKVCQRRIKGGCTVCTQLSTLCCFHAHSCKDTKCPVLLCSTIKRKIRLANKKGK